MSATYRCRKKWRLCCKPLVVVEIPEKLRGDHRRAIRVNGAGESHWSMSHGPENIYSDRRCNFCCSSVAPPVTSLHGVASYDRRLDSADVGKLDCFRRSGRLELLRIKTPHAASLMAASCPCCAALKIGSKCLCWVIFDVSSARRALPVYPQLRTYRCIALIDAEGHFQTRAPQQNSSLIRSPRRRRGHQSSCDGVDNQPLNRRTKMMITSIRLRPPP